MTTVSNSTNYTGTLSVKGPCVQGGPEGPWCKNRTSWKAIPSFCGHLEPFVVSNHAEEEMSADNGGQCAQRKPATLRLHVVFGETFLGGCGDRAKECADQSSLTTNFPN